MKTSKNTFSAKRADDMDIDKARVEYLLSYEQYLVSMEHLAGRQQEEPEEEQSRLPAALQKKIARLAEEHNCSEEEIIEAVLSENVDRFGKEKKLLS